MFCVERVWMTGYELTDINSGSESRETESANDQSTSKSIEKARKKMIDQNINGIDSDAVYPKEPVNSSGTKVEKSDSMNSESRKLVHNESQSSPTQKKSSVKVEESSQTSSTDNQGVAAVQKENNGENSANLRSITEEGTNYRKSETNPYVVFFIVLIIAGALIAIYRYVIYKNETT